MTSFENLHSQKKILAVPTSKNLHSQKFFLAVSTSKNLHSQKFILAVTLFENLHSQKISNLIATNQIIRDVDGFDSNDDHEFMHNVRQYIC